MRTNPQEPYGLGEAYHKVDLDIIQSNVLSTTPHNNITEQGSDSSILLSGDGHHKEIYSTSDQLTNAEDVKVQSFNNLDSNNNLSRSSSNSSHNLNRSILIAIFSIFLLMT